MEDTPPLCERILSFSTNASHADEIVFVPPQRITSSASRPETFDKISRDFHWKEGLILLLKHAAFENDYT